MSPESHSVTRWIERLRHGDDQALAALWTRFVERMLGLARQRLGTACRRVADEEDIVVVAFERFQRGARQGRFPRLSDRDDLWAVLSTLTDRIAIDELRRQAADKRGGGIVRGDSALNGVDGEPIDGDWTPAQAALFQDSLSRLLGVLGDDALHEIALARMEGQGIAEIAARIGRAEATVHRRLDLIRQTWLRCGLVDPEK